uniref:Uncharacterized protein n=1 Tax=Arundo donax TaxID=35708 RepID=A0A0A9BYQ7_ARUDO
MLRCRVDMIFVNMGSTISQMSWVCISSNQQYLVRPPS